MILIVDDRQENIFSLRTVLEQHGFETDGALSGEEALKKLLKNEYALIILDVQMPVMDGFEVAEAVGGLNKTKDIPIIFLSAVNTHKRFVTKGFESGAVEYLTKPVDPDILILKVQNFYRLFEKTQKLKEAEKSLTLTVDELHTTLESLPQIAFTTDREGQILYVNNHWLEYAPSKTAFPETKPEYPSLQQQWLALTQEGTAVEKEVLLKHRDDNQYYYHLLKITPIKINGFVTKWVGTLTNIHEQKMLNETLERKVIERTQELTDINRELEITNNDLQQFSSVASHDLKEPLRKIQFFGNLLKDRATLEEAHAVFLNKIILSAERMRSLINDLLSFASLSAPSFFQITNINSLIKEIMDDLELSMQEKEATIEVAPFPEMEVIPGLIRQLFQNLISNALKFAKPDVPPVIQITVDRVMLPTVESETAINGSYCRIRIMDNGIGFNDKYVDKIFAIFQRLNDRTQYEGTGIGLAIAKKIVDRHNGFITAQAVPGEGATFYVILPVKQEVPLPVVQENNLFKPRSINIL
jgi:signal transduction histidine kinase